MKRTFWKAADSSGTRSFFSAARMSSSKSYAENLRGYLRSGLPLASSRNFS